ncbi:MAG: hypothetical protein AAGA68_22745 [Pseudomonadota bacterium]
MTDNADGTWTGDCLDIVEGQNLFAYAVVTYAFDDNRYSTIPLRVKGDPLTYNGEDPYRGDFILSSNLLQIHAQELIDAAIDFRPEGSLDQLHDFANGWDDWLLPNGWSNAGFWFASTRKPWDPRYRPSSDAALSIDVRVDGTKHFFLVADQNDSLFFLGTEVPLLRYYAGITVTGDGTWQTVTVNRSDFRPTVISVDSLESLFPGMYPDLREPMARWDDVLVLTIESNVGGTSVYNPDGSISVLPGSSWEVEERQFRNLRWGD